MKNYNISSFSETSVKHRKLLSTNYQKYYRDL